MLPFVTSATILRNAQFCNGLPEICSVVLMGRPRQRYSSSDCGPDDLLTGARKDLKEQPFPGKVYKGHVSMWENPRCCEPVCDVIRHDILYLKEQPKKYTRTWNECTEMKKMVWECKGEIEPPETMQRPVAACMAPRDPNRCPRCEGDPTKLGLMPCQKPPNMNVPCPRIRMPCCKAARVPPVCEKSVIHPCCQKRCTLYPAYSECKRDGPPTKPPSECACLKIPSMCEVYNLFRTLPLK